jgi:hypothetical protein
MHLRPVASKHVLIHINDGEAKVCLDKKLTDITFVSAPETEFIVN